MFSTRGLSGALSLILCLPTSKTFYTHAVCSLPGVLLFLQSTWQGLRRPNRLSMRPTLRCRIPPPRHCKPGRKSATERPHTQTTDTVVLNSDSARLTPPTRASVSMKHRPGPGQAGQGLRSCVIVPPSPSRSERRGKPADTSARSQPRGASEGRCSTPEKWPSSKFPPANAYPVPFTLRPRGRRSPNTESKKAHTRVRKKQHIPLVFGQHIRTLEADDDMQLHASLPSAPASHALSFMPHAARSHERLVLPAANATGRRGRNARGPTSGRVCRILVADGVNP